MTPISSRKHLGTKVIQANGPAAITCTQVCVCVMKLNYSKTYLNFFRVVVLHRLYCISRMRRAVLISKKDTIEVNHDGLRKFRLICVLVMSLQKVINMARKCLNLKPKTNSRNHKKDPLKTDSHTRIYNTQVPA